MARIFISHSSLDDEAAARMKAWLARQGLETTFLDFDKTTGIPPGADWEKTLYREVEQSQAVIIIQTPNWLASKWCFAEFTQARALGKAIFLVIETPTGDAQISPDIQTLNLLSDCEGGLERLSRELVRIALDAQGGFTWDASRPPFPGLLAFEEEDAAIYFGRDDDIRRLIERLDARRAQGGAKLVALLGSSGSGKSSLLRAGVVPRLKRAGRNWIVAPPMRPRLHPVDELAVALVGAFGPGADWRKLKDDLLRPDPARALADFANDLRVNAGAGEAQILIPIDQAEEVFGVAGPDEARLFLQILSQALSESLPFMAVMAMRSDYLGRLQSAAALTARFEEFSLGPMPLTRIPQIIQGPRLALRFINAALASRCYAQQLTRHRDRWDVEPLLRREGPRRLTMADHVTRLDISRNVRAKRSIRFWAGVVSVTGFAIPASIAAWRGVKWGVATVTAVAVIALGGFTALLVSAAMDADQIWRKLGIVAIAAFPVWVGWRHVSVVLPYLRSGERSILFPEYSWDNMAAKSGLWHNLKTALPNKRTRALAWMFLALPAGISTFLVMARALDTITNLFPEIAAPWLDTFDFYELLEVLIFAAALGVMYFLFRRGLRHIAPPAAAIRRDDPRPPIVLLRSFRDEDTSIQRSLDRQVLVGLFEKIPERLDELLEQSLHPYGPVIAIGRPKEALPSLGAAREYVLDADWKSFVETRLREAGLVVGILGDTDGFVWEMGAVFRLSMREKLILVVPQMLSSRQRFGRWKRVVKALDAGFELPTGALVVAWDDDNVIVVTGGLLYRDAESYAMALASVLDRLSARAPCVLRHVKALSE